MTATFSCAVVAVLATGMLTLHHTDEQPTIRTTVDVVTIDAWVHDDGEGCVNGIRDLLVGLGFQARVEDAMDFDFQTEQDEPEEDEEEEPVVFSRRLRP